jgi:hypothetical protein
MPRGTTLLGILACMTPLACGATVHPGLANAPALSNVPVADAAVQDVVANGRDSCERGLGPGPLRYQFPPCPGVERPAAVVITSRPRGMGDLYLPWVEHYYSRWSCPWSARQPARMTLVRLGAPDPEPDHVLKRLTCLWPL